MKVLVTFSGGKDSLASLLWVREHITKNFTTVFCDTGWEHPLTYEYIQRIADKLSLDLVTLKSKKYDGMADLAHKKKRWPSTRARFCAEELKTKPMIDYILDEVQDNVMVIQGIRGAESPARAAMSKQCTYFKYYFEPYGFDKNGKPKKHSYRGRDVRACCKQFAADVQRPVFDWSAQQVMDYILDAGLEPNPTSDTGCGLLPTPRATEIIEDPVKCAVRKGDWTANCLPNLSSAVVFGLLPTPTTNDSNNNPETPSQTNRDNLVGTMRRAGLTTSQLNPRFVAEMMGFPPDWTELPFRSGEWKALKPTEMP